MQSATPGRTTLLDATNVLLRNIGEMPVNSLEDEQIQDARIAEQTLLEFHKEGQIRGWSWNREAQYPFDRDADTGEIEVPASTMTWLVDPYHDNGRYVLRGTKVYDKKNRTFKINANDAPIEADVIWLLSFDEVPEAFNRWVTIRAARIFSDRALGSEALFKYTMEDEKDAQAELERIELEQEQANMLTGAYAFPTYQPNTGLMNRRVANGYSIF